MSDLLAREVTASVTAQLTCTAEAYRRLLYGTKQATLHVREMVMQMDLDPDPSKRRVRTLRQFVRQVRDIMAWEYRKAQGRAPRGTLKVTVPLAAINVDLGHRNAWDLEVRSHA